MESVLMTTLSRDEVKELFREVVREENTRKDTGSLISYKEISEVYNVGETTISRKVSEAKLDIQKIHYDGRLRNAITKPEAERLFRKVRHS